ncbi:MAG: DUF2478 domain-containing protein [Rhodobacter sp.]|nr:DUF2478 domain-containing protein [Rhodobacter sp.]
MRIAYTMAPGRGDTDRILLTLAQSLQARGLRLAGTVQINTDRTDGGPCDMDVLVLPQGPVLRISQTLGRAARGCRLDPSALETAVAHVDRGMSGPIDMLILNKFGKHEAEGRGFRPLIADAVMRDIPVLVGVNGLNRAAFLDFVGGEARCLDPRLDALTDWCHAALPPDRATPVRQTA